MQRRSVLQLFALFFFIPAVLSLSSCKDDEETPALDRDKFLGSYDFTDYKVTHYNGQQYPDTNTGIFFIEVPADSLGLGENYIILRGLTCNDCRNRAIVLGNDFMFEATSSANTTGNGTTANNGETLSIDYTFSAGISGTTGDVTATQR